MNQLVITRKSQTGFLEAVETRDLKNWHDEKQEFLKHIANRLKKIKIPPSHREKEQICQFICNSFLVLFTIHWEDCPDLLRPDTIVGQFVLKLKAAYDSNRWHQFYRDYENYFDSLIHLAREQKIVDIRIEDTKKMKCLSFQEAKKNNDTCIVNDFKRAENGVNFGAKIDKSQDQQNNKQSGGWFCCSRDETPRENKANRSRNVMTQQPVLETPIQPRQLSSESFQLENGSTTDGPKNITSDKQKISKKTGSTVTADFQEFDNQLKAIVSSTTWKEEESSKVGQQKVPVDQEQPAVHRAPSQTSYSSTDWEKRRNQMDASFQRKLNEQNEKFAEKLRKVRENRERLNREAEEDMRQFRKESAMRIHMFLRCIQLRIRWEDQEQEWGDWLRSVRGPVVRVKNAFFEMNSSRRYDDEEENRSEIMDLQRCVQNAYDKLTYEFGNLAMLSEQFEDKLFLKVLQKRISHVATKLCILMEDLDEFQNNASFFSKLKQQQSQIDSMEIPTTSELRRICKNASPDEYNFITPPKLPKSYCVINEI